MQNYPMSEEREPIIDELLEELLGGQRPPDLTQRILDAHESESYIDRQEVPRVDTRRRAKT